MEREKKLQIRFVWFFFFCSRETKFQTRNSKLDAGSSRASRKLEKNRKKKLLVHLNPSRAKLEDNYL